MKETYTIKDNEDLKPCTTWIKELFTLHGSLEVTISTGTRSRSVLQNSLYWLWVTELASHMGLLKEETHASSQGAEFCGIGGNESCPVPEFAYIVLIDCRFMPLVTH